MFAHRCEWERERESGRVRERSMTNENTCKLIV